MSLVIRPCQPQDADACARILYAAFEGIANAHRFPPDFPNLEAVQHMVPAFITAPGMVGFVAELDGVIAGSNFISTTGPIRGVGPISVDPSQQGGGIGRALMNAVLEHASGAPGVRLLQDAFNPRSMALYTSLGFDIKEPVALLDGRPSSAPAMGWTVRRFAPEDMTACSELSIAAHGFDRSGDLAMPAPFGDAWVAEKDGTIRAYATALRFWPMNHAVASDEGAMRALILGAAANHNDPLSFLVPTRNASLFRWCLTEGLRIRKPMTLMAIGEYHDPATTWTPSVMY